MSKELDDRIDGLRRRLITTAAQPITMGNYKQQLRSYQEMMLELINITDAVNADDDISGVALNALKMQVSELLAKSGQTEEGSDQ